MKADLHVHSKFSTRPSQWVLQKINCPESFTEPLKLYKTARERGMSLVTITDHNTILGALEIAHLEDAFVSEEITAYFPEDRCKIHVLAYRISEKQHEDIQSVRDNIYDLAAYLHQQEIIHAVAHPLYSINGRLTSDHFEKLLLLFENFELNGAREEFQNDLMRLLLTNLTREDLDFLADKHGLEPFLEKPWKKNLVGGSDDHSSLNIARLHTEVSGAATIDEFLKGVTQGRANILGKGSLPQTLAHNLYGIAYQFYRDRLKLGRHVNKDLVLRFLDRVLRGKQDAEEGVWSRIYYLWNSRIKPRHKSGHIRPVQQLFKEECQKLIISDPELMKLVKNGSSHVGDMEQKWFDFVNTLSNKVLLHFGDHILDHLSGANVFDIFTSLGSAGALYALLAPYFVSFSVFSQDRQVAENVIKDLDLDLEIRPRESDRIHVAHFTDTFYEINGVALTLKQQVANALKTGKKLTVMTCDTEEPDVGLGVRNFRPIGRYELPEYPEMTLYYPPFMEMLLYCYENQVTHIHAATPGPIGLAALAISRILKLPISGTYHTSLPQYTMYLTGDRAMEDLMWKYVTWFYEQMDTIFVPSHSTGQELADKGLKTEKIKLYPRGIDIQRFHPDKADPRIFNRYQVRGKKRLMYVGRVSKEKNLELLVDVYKNLLKSDHDVSLIVVGDGPYLEEMKVELQDAPAVFTGYLEGNDLPVLYASCDLFVFPSTTDTFGNVVLEAQASGLPVLVTDLGGPHENILSGQTGLVAPGNDGPAFLENIRTLLADDGLRTEMKGQARQYMEERSFEGSFDQTWKIYEGRAPETERLAGFG